MPEAKSRFVEKILDGKNAGDETKAFTSERQLTAQAFNLHVEKRDGRHSEGFAWSHYTGYCWADSGDVEKLIVLFGDRAVEIEGHNLSELVGQIRQGQLNGIKEMPSAQVALKKQNGDAEAVISSVTIYPDLEEMIRELKGDDHDTGFVGKVRGR
jgi:hypothetical protein